MRSKGAQSSTGIYLMAQNEIASLIGEHVFLPAGSYITGPPEAQKAAIEQ
jgi:hypothetical protein